MRHIPVEERKQLLVDHIQEFHRFAWLLRKSRMSTSWRECKAMVRDNPERAVLLLMAAALAFEPDHPLYEQIKQLERYEGISK